MNLCNCGGCETCKSDLYSDAIRCMVSALEYRDPYTKGHSLRVGEMTAYISKQLDLGQSNIIQIHIAGQLHDIGKIGVSDKTLLKVGRLNDEEWLEIRKHPEIGSSILRESNQLKDIAKMVEQHHERWDGSGYPNHIIGDNITIGGRILALCDALDAMASSRPYRPSMSWTHIKNEMKKNIGTQFDPIFTNLIDPLIEFWKSRYDVNNV